MLHDNFHIDHSTLEFENINCCDKNGAAGGTWTPTS